MAQGEGIRRWELRKWVRRNKGLASRSLGCSGGPARRDQAVGYHSDDLGLRSARAITGEIRYVTEEGK